LLGQSASTVHCCRQSATSFSVTQIELQQGFCVLHVSPRLTQLAHSAAVPHTFLVMLLNFMQQPDVQSPSASHGMRQMGDGVAVTHSLPAQHVAPALHGTSTGRQPPTPEPALPPVPEPPVPNPPEPEAPPPDPPVAEPPTPVLPPPPKPPLDVEAADPPAAAVPPAPPLLLDDALDPPLPLPELADDPPLLGDGGTESESLLQPLAAATRTMTLPITNVRARTDALLHEAVQRKTPHTFRRIRATLFSSGT
jgi:hypothetical protein